MSIFRRKEKYELVSYADNMCISFGIDRYYDFKLIKFIRQYLEHVDNNLRLTFSVAKCRLIVLDDQGIVHKVKAFNLVYKQFISHIRQLKNLGMIINYRL